MCGLQIGDKIRPKPLPGRPRAVPDPGVAPSVVWKQIAFAICFRHTKSALETDSVSYLFPAHKKCPARPESAPARKIVDS